MSKRTLLLNSFSGVALLVTNIVVAFVMSPIMIHALGNRNYGIWELLMALVGYLGLLELGIGSALVRFVADAWSREDRATLDRIFNTGVFSLAGTGMIGLLVLLVGAVWSERLFGLGGSEARELAPVLIVFGINLAAYLPRIALSAYLLGMQAHRVVNSILIIVTVIVSVAVYHILTAGLQSPLIWMAFAVFCGTIFQILLIFLWIVIVDRKVRIAVSSFSMKTMKELLGFGLKNMIVSASEGLLGKLVSVAIAYTAGVGQVVYFVIPNRLVEYVRGLAWQLGVPLTPYFADLAGRGEPSAARSAWIQTTRILQVVLLGAPLAVAALGEPFIGVWIGQEYAERGQWVLYILCAGLFAQGIVANGFRLLMSLNRHGRFALFSAIFAPICFGVSLGLGSVWGLEGVAAAVSLYVVGLSAVEVTLTCRVLGVTLSEYVRATALRFAIPITAMGGVLIGLRAIAYPTGYGELLLHGLLAGTVYLITVWFIALDPAERKYAMNIIGRLQRKMPVALRPRLDHEQD